MYTCRMNIFRSNITESIDTAQPTGESSSSLREHTYTQCKEWAMAIGSSAMRLLNYSNHDNEIVYRGVDPPGINIQFEPTLKDRQALTDAIAESVRSGRAGIALRGGQDLPRSL